LLLFGCGALCFAQVFRVPTASEVAGAPDAAQQSRPELQV